MPVDATGARDIRHIVGGPHRAIVLDDAGRNATSVASGTPAHLPVIGGDRREEV